LQYRPRWFPESGGFGEGFRYMCHGTWGFNCPLGPVDFGVIESQGHQDNHRSEASHQCSDNHHMETSHRK
jgi:hypothetical protein